MFRYRILEQFSFGGHDIKKYTKANNMEITAWCKNYAISNVKK